MSRKVRTKRTTVSRRPKKKSKSRSISVRVFSFLVLLGLLVFSMGAAGYVIFFRTAIAHGAEGESGPVDIAFEEPYTSFPELPSDIPPAHDSSLPMVAIIIDDMGYHKKIGNELLALPMNLTFSFLAAAPFTPELEEKAFQAGRVILLHQPMEPKGKEWDPGPGAMFLGQSKEEQKRLFTSNLEAVPHAVGVNNHMGSLYTADREAMDAFMQLLQEQGLFFVDSFTSADSQGLTAARAAGVPTARRHIFLDNVHSPDKVCEQLKKLVQSADENGWAIGIGHPNEATLTALTNCRGKLLKRIRLVSAQELLIVLNKQ
ncbi:MAG: divergent polysaccharide deacetylase family protein [Thermodesulfobacteriota bacterium]|nr:divergent polysaccharide deacetylase family protein [Thermodesulfobacteriota bacterium]